MEGSKSPAPIKMKFHMLNSEPFAILLHKICSTPMEESKARVNLKIKKEIKKAQKEIYAQYQEQVLKAHCPVDAEGKPKLGADGQPLLPETPEKMEALQKANIAFGEQEYELPIGPFRPSLLKGVQLSANEIETLDNLYTEEDGPGLPPQLLNLVQQ